jgi:hypothetical protein
VSSDGSDRRRDTRAGDGRKRAEAGVQTEVAETWEYDGDEGENPDEDARPGREGGGVRASWLGSTCLGQDKEWES